MINITVHFLLFDGIAIEVDNNKLILDKLFKDGDTERAISNRIIKTNHKTYKIIPNEDSITFQKIVDDINIEARSEQVLQHINFTAKKSKSFLNNLNWLVDEIAKNTNFADISYSGIICCPIALACSKHIRDIIGHDKIDYRFLGHSYKGITPTPFILLYKFSNGEMNPYENIIYSFFEKVNKSKLTVYERQHVKYIKLVEDYVKFFAKIVDQYGELLNLTANTDKFPKHTKEVEDD